MVIAFVVEEGRLGRGRVAAEAGRASVDVDLVCPPGVHGPGKLENVGEECRWEQGEVSPLTPQ